MNRVLGEIVGDLPGPLSILVGGIHGNEAAGIKAIFQVFRALRERKIPVAGTLLGIAGNLQAIGKNIRFVDYDLNRCWWESNIKRVYGKGHTYAEDIELYALHELLVQRAAEHSGPKVLMDLHTTSAARGNFIVISEAEASHPIIRSLKQPVVIDLDQYLKGTLLRYFKDHGYLSFAFEGGMIGTQEAIDLHVAGIWEFLQASGNINPSTGNADFFQSHILQQYSNDLPAYLRVLYHHWIEPMHQFEMMPGFENFQPVSKGEVVAHDRYGPVTAPIGGLIFMPLYQTSGNDGFFIVEEVSQSELPQIP